MADRKPITKKMRFEVFKRDKFTCQYCGAKAPDAILEVDHIKPVAEGGGNDILNLVTACRDCNRGKGRRMLSDDAIVSAKRRQLDELAARREQIQMMYEWELSLVDSENDEVNAVESLFNEMTGGTFTEAGRKHIRNLCRKFGLDIVLKATRKSFTHYGFGTSDEMENALGKIGGICFNMTHKRCHQCNQMKYRTNNDEVFCKVLNGRVDIDEAELCGNYDPWFGGDAE